MTTPSPALVKGLFYHLVKAVGGVEAAGAYLGVSHQRVSQLCSIGPEGEAQNMPTVLQIMTLEAAVGQPIVTGALARLVSSNVVLTDPLKEAGDVVVAASRTFELIRGGADAKAAMPEVIKLEREVGELADSLRGDAA